MLQCTVDNVCYDRCDKLIHKTRTKVSDNEYTKMQEKAVDTEKWLCNPCIYFPFNDIYNGRFLSLNERSNQIPYSLDINNFANK